MKKFRWMCWYEVDGKVSIRYDFIITKGEGHYTLPLEGFIPG